MVAFKAENIRNNVNPVRCVGGGVIWEKDKIILLLTHTPVGAPSPLPQEILFILNEKQGRSQKLRTFT